MKQKVIFSIPTITGAIRAETAISLIETFQALWMLGIESDIHTLSDCPDLEVARNTLTAMFRADKDATDHFWIDYDVKFPADAVIALLNRPEDVVAGAYRVKLDNKEEYSVVPKFQDGVPVGKVDEDGTALLEADFVATGFLRIKRHVYDKIQEAYPELRYDDNVIKTVNHPIKEAWDFFAKRIRTTDGGTRRFTTEDYAFCQRWRDIGGQVWIYPDIQFDHIGKKAYSGNMHEFLLSMPGSHIAKALSIPGWMSVKELHWLATRKYPSIAEVGCWMGRSTNALALGGGIVYAIDTWEGSEEHEDIIRGMGDGALYNAFIENIKGFPNVIPVKQKSVEAAKMIGDVDMVFIDAAHDYESVKADIQAWLPKTRSLICGHDYVSYPGVKQAVNELLPDAFVVPGTDIWACYLGQNDASTS